jgi:DNA polymerase III subunit delta
MVAVKAQELDRFLSGPSGTKLFLVYGPDQGAVSERAGQIEAAARNRDPSGGTLRRVASDELSADPGLIADEAYSASLFGGAPIIRLRVTDGRHNVAGAVEPLFERPPEEAWLIVEAGDLRPAAPLRKLFEQSPAAAAVPCYSGDAREVAALARQVLREAGLAAEPDALDLLAALLGADRLATRNELEKLVLYALGSGRVSVEDVEAAVGENVEVRNEEVVDAALLGNSEAVERGIARLRAEGHAPQALAGSGIRQLIQLQALALQRQGGRTIDLVVERARPPIFFKRKDAVKAILARWSREELAAARDVLAEAVALARRQPALEAALVSAALQRIAAKGQRLARARRSASAPQGR